MAAQVKDGEDQRDVLFLGCSICLPDGTFFCQNGWEGFADKQSLTKPAYAIFYGGCMMEEHMRCMQSLWRKPKID